MERKKCHKGVLLGSDLAEEEKKRRKCQKQIPSNLAQPLDSVDQTGSICGMMRAGGVRIQLTLPITEFLTTSRCGVRE